MKLCVIKIDSVISEYIPSDCKGIKYFLIHHMKIENKTSFITDYAIFPLKQNIAKREG